MKTLIIDNRDSMTFNLFQYVAEVNGREPLVLRNDELPWEAVAALDIDNIIISPGPGRPERPADFGVSAQAIRHARVPVLGVCLGHQGIGWLLGGRVRHAPQPVHGRISLVRHTGEELFAGIPSPFAAARYHSLLLATPLPADLEATAWTADGLIMGIRSRSRPLWGVQFHPESIGTDHGRRLLANFMGCTEAFHRRKTPRPAAQPPRPASPRPAAELIIHSRRLPCDMDSARLFAGLFGHARHAFWLDSSLARPGLARFSFMGDAAGPLAEVATCRDRTLTIHRNAAAEVRQQSIFEYLRQRLRGCAVRGGEALPFDFAGGYVGYFGYELKRECGAAPGPMARTPDAAWLFADRLVAIDHAAGELWLVCLAADAREARRWLDAMEQRLDRPLPEPAMGAPAAGEAVSFHLRHSPVAYLRRIRACLEDIRNGESYEICLTNQLATRTRPPLLDLYSHLRRINPAPHAAFLRLPGAAVLCSSPERFLRIDRQGLMEARPIKGTIRRGRDAAEDARLRQALLNSEKDRAENLMIVDLLRNDLGRVAETGSVRVAKLMDIETYATVHQLVSTVRGRLRPGLDAIDAVQAAFPGGSMTGAPKLRTLEIIDRLEGGPRGVYSGALGFLSLNGALDLNVVIRTIVADGAGLTVGCGGAITALSDPESELAEMLLKAQAPLRAIALAASGSEDRWRIDNLDAGPVAHALASCQEG